MLYEPLFLQFKINKYGRIYYILNYFAGVDNSKSSDKDLFMLLKLLLVLAVFIASALSLHIRDAQSHKYWFNKHHPNYHSGKDSKWDYCDYKCVYLETLINNKDFVVITFTAPLKEVFSACYVKVGKEYTLWSKVYHNDFFEETCGSDNTDWYETGDFSVQGVYGVGIGSPLETEEMY